MKRIICHGDSLTEGDEIEQNFTWPALLGNRLNVEVRNTGIGGDTSGGLLGRFYPDVVQQKPDAVLIMGGTNDLWWDLEINPILANLFAMACQAEYHRIAPVIGLPIPVCLEKAEKTPMMAPVNGFDRCQEKLTGMRGALKRACEQSEVPLVDFFSLFMDEKDGVIADYYLEDGLHPNLEGHRLMARKAARLMKAVFKVP